MGLVAANGGFGCGSRPLEPQSTQTITECAIERRPERGQARGVVGQRGVDDRRFGRGHGDGSRADPGGESCAGSDPPRGGPTVVDVEPRPGPCRSRRDETLSTVDAFVFRHRDDRRAWIPPRNVLMALPFAIDHGLAVWWHRVQGRGVWVSGPRPRRSGYPRASVRGSGLSTIGTAPCGKPTGTCSQVSADGRLARAGRPMLRRTTSMTSSV